jgi:hypothetical protein
MTTIGVTQGRKIDARKKPRARSHVVFSASASTKARISIGGTYSRPITSVFHRLSTRISSSSMTRKLPKPIHCMEVRPSHFTKLRKKENSSGYRPKIAKRMKNGATKR